MDKLDYLGAIIGVHRRKETSWLNAMFNEGLHKGMRLRDYNKDFNDKKREHHGGLTVGEPMELLAS